MFMTRSNWIHNGLVLASLALATSACGPANGKFRSRGTTTTIGGLNGGTLVITNVKTAPSDLGIQISFDLSDKANGVTKLTLSTSQYYGRGAGTDSKSVGSTTYSMQTLCDDGLCTQFAALLGIQNNATQMSKNSTFLYGPSPYDSQLERLAGPLEPAPTDIAQALSALKQQLLYMP